MYITVVGAGNIGTPLIEIAIEDGNEVVAVEHDEARAGAAAATFDCLVLGDDATVKQTPDEAGTDCIDTATTTTDKDATNIVARLLAKGLNTPDIISVIHSPKHMSLCRQIGINMTENLQRLIVEYPYRAIKRPSIVDHVRIGKHAEIFEIRVDENALITGMTIQGVVQENLLDGDTLIVTVERGGDDGPMTPCRNTAIGVGDLSAVYSAEGAAPEVTDVSGHYRGH